MPVQTSTQHYQSYYDVAFIIVYFPHCNASQNPDIVAPQWLFQLPPRTIAEEYQNRATSPQTQAKFLDLAATWTKLASDLEAMKVLLESEDKPSS